MTNPAFTCYFVWFFGDRTRVRTFDINENIQKNSVILILYINYLTASRHLRQNWFLVSFEQHRIIVSAVQESETEKDNIFSPFNIQFPKNIGESFFYQYLVFT